MTARALPRKPTVEGLATEYVTRVTKLVRTGVPTQRPAHKGIVFRALLAASCTVVVELRSGGAGPPAPGRATTTAGRPWVQRRPLLRPAVPGCHQ